MVGLLNAIALQRAFSADLSVVISIIDDKNRRVQGVLIHLKAERSDISSAQSDDRGRYEIEASKEGFA